MTEPQSLRASLGHEHDQALAARPTILCIDDDPAIAESLRVRLQQTTIEVKTATTYQQGLRAARAERPDLVIVDHGMPDGSGLLVVEHLKLNEATRYIPVLVMTGCDSPSLRARMTSLGVQHFLIKPVPWTRLKSLLELCLPTTAIAETIDCF